MMMGWSYAPYIAHGVALYILLRAVSRVFPALTREERIRYALMWIDDGACGGSPVETVALRDAFLVVAREYGVDLKEVSGVAPSHEYVGLLFDCARRRWRLKSAWVDKLVLAVKRFRGRTTVPLSTAWRLLWLSDVGPPRSPPPPLLFGPSRGPNLSLDGRL